MIFKQYENGSCDIIFSKEEIKIIKKKQCIHLSDEALRHFGNHLVHVVSQWQIKFNDEVKKLSTHEDTEVSTKLENNTKKINKVR
jgi:hypothetical protein